MRKAKEPFTILMADDDEDDFFLVRSALQDTGIAKEVRFVPDGKALMDYLLRIGEYEDPESSPCPDLILLDLNMPRMDGREALREIKSSPQLRTIPVVILTTSKEERDVTLTYAAGASSFITKPMTFDEWTDMARIIGAYWFSLVTLPPKEPEC